MEAVVLAGGYATRLWPVTKNRPKMLLPVGETTVIDRILTELEADDRIDGVYVSTNERFAEDFRDHMAESVLEKPTLSIEETTEEDEKFGVVGALAQLVEREGLDGEDLLVVAGDNLISFGLSDFLDDFDEHGTTTIAAYDVGSYDRASAYGVVELDDERVVEFQEKPEDPKSTLVAFPFEEAWFDIGTPESYLEAVAWELDGESIIAESATVESSTIGENVHILPGAEVVDSTIDQSIIFSDSTIRDSEIRESIIDQDTHIENLDLAGALIGAHTHIANGH